MGTAARGLPRRKWAERMGDQPSGCHPGMTRTDLIANNAARWSISAITRCFSPVLYQPAWRGVFATLYAAADRQSATVAIRNLTGWP